MQLHALIECRLGDRTLLVEFIETGDGVNVRETYDTEDGIAVEQQRAGWQPIPDDFARHVGTGPRGLAADSRS